MPWKYQRGRTWWIGYRLNGRQVLRSTGSADEAVADKEIARLNSMREAHKAGSLSEEFFRLLTQKQFGGDSLRAYVDQWLKECKDLSPVTLKRYRDEIDGFCEYLNATEDRPLLRDVDTRTIAAYLRKRKAETSTATAKVIRKILSAFFGYAVDNQALPTNPVPSSKSLKLTVRDGRNGTKRRAFTLKELRLLFEKAPDDFWRYMLLAGFYCGQRMGDLICLPWGAVDFEQDRIHMTTSKTGRALHIPLRPELRQFLLTLKKKAGTVKPGNPIWPEQAKRYQERGAAGFSNEFYEDVLLPAGLVPPRTHKAKKQGRAGARAVNSVSFHSLRHTFVSLLKLSGGSQAVAKELAGHSSDAVSDLYTHVPEEALAKAIKQLPEVTK